MFLSFIQDIVMAADDCHFRVKNVLTCFAVPAGFHNKGFKLLKTEHKAPITKESSNVLDPHFKVLILAGWQ